MIVKEINGGVLLTEVHDFDAKHIFECGQCFRWYREPDGSYTGVAYGKVVNIKSDPDHASVMIRNTDQKDFEKIWRKYLDLDRDYSVIKQELSKDPVLQEAMKYGQGIRILRQEPWELLISFIISANNNIPRIMKSIAVLSEIYGEPIVFEGKVYHAFPTPQQLKSAQLEEIDVCKFGYRCKYILEAIKLVNSLEINLNEITGLETEAAKKELLRVPGVGPKVADCILLFSMGKHEVYPIDVWVKRVTEHFYLGADVKMNEIQRFAKEKFGELAGFAQQYLFYYAREQKITID